MQEAFNGARDNKKPRSIGLPTDGHNICVSWATYDTDKTTDVEDADVVKRPVQCAQSGASAAFQTEIVGDCLPYICVSDRARGCQQNVC